MSTVKNYVSFDKLSKYHDLEVLRVKAEDDKVLAAAKEYAEGLAPNYDAVGTAATEAGKVQANLDTEVLRAKAAEEANAAAAKQAQDEVDALEGVVAGMYTNKQIDDAIAAAQSTATYDDTQVKDDIQTNKDAIAAEKERAMAAEKVNADAIAALDTKVGTVEEGKTVVGMIGDVSAAVDAHKEAIDGKVTTLIGDDVNKSVRTIANEELAAQLLSGDAEADFKTLQELAAWLEEHPEDVAAINLAIENLEKLVGTIPEGATATDIVGYIAEVVAAEKTRAEGIESGLDTRLKAVETAIGENGSVDEMIDAAIEAAMGAEETRVDGLLAGKVDKVEGKGLSTNDLTNELKEQYDAAYAHSQVAHAPANAQENKIETVKVNGTAVTITDKAVDITVPTDNKDLTNGAGYLVAADIANKADKATTLAGYGIADAYTKTETDTAISTAMAQMQECTDSDINSLFA